MIKFIMPSKKIRLSMNIRLFMFLTALVLTLILGIMSILIVTGIFTAGLTYSTNIIEKDLQHASDDISSELAYLSVQTIQYAAELSQSIEKKIQKFNVDTVGIPEHPELLEEIISNEYERTRFFLQISKSSGVFFMLDATVNPALDYAQYSKAGLYLKNMEPNIISSSSPNIILLRGFPSIGRSNSLALHSQWSLEFDTSSTAYFKQAIEAANNHPSLPLSRLYHWTTLTWPETSEKVMICTVPLIDSNGHVFGAAGIEISEMLFKLSFMPHNNIYNRLFCSLTPMKNNKIIPQQSMVAGGYSARSISNSNHPLILKKNNERYLSFYQFNSGKSFLGKHTPVYLYPKDSAYSDEQWVVAAMVPESDITTSVTKLNVKLFLLLLLLFILGIAASFILSKKYLEPITEGLNIIKSNDLSKAPRTQIPELDELIDFLNANQHEIYERAIQEDLSISVLDDFLENTKTLSPAERRVFNLFVKGYKAKEIAEQLCLSINTIKTHNKRIFMKLDIASREELILYVNMLKEIGKDI